jgi:nucleotide-binding universal stress UspA family protein
MIADARMQSAASMVEEMGLRPKKRIEVGVPYREILRVAKEEDVSLIISGRQKRSALGEIFIGSNTDRVIRYGTIPVYIPKYPAAFGGSREDCLKYCENPFRRVLYPTDWSDCAKTALKYLKGLKGAGIDEVVIAHIMNEKAMSLQPPDKFREFEKIDRQKLGAVQQELQAEGFSVKVRLEIGKAGKELITIARQEDVSLIIMGSRGKGYVAEILWGSVSRNVVEYSDRPILLIKGFACQEEVRE